MTHRPAGFLVRLLADLVDDLLFGLAISIPVFFLASSQTLAELVYGFLLYLIVLLMPLTIFSYFYKALFTYRFGGNIGKLITGLKVTGLNGDFLTLKRSLFRYAIAQTFSLVLFGLGYLSIIKDPEKRAFHDKATPSKVVITSNLWPLGLVVLIALITTHFLLWANTIQKFSQSPLKSEFGFLMLNLDQQLKNVRENKKPLPSPDPLNNYLEKLEKTNFQSR